MSDPTPATPARPLVLEDLLSMRTEELRALMARGAPLDEAALADSQYLGVDLSLPAFLGRLLWKTFRKTFHRDPETGVLRGWNVRMEQRGVRGLAIPQTDRRGDPRTFGHYDVRPAAHLRFPHGLRCSHYLAYGASARVRKVTPWRFVAAPLVAVNAGSMDLLLGWELLGAGGRFLSLPLYWALERQGSLQRAVPPR